MGLDDYDGQTIPGDECGLNFPTLSYTWGRTPERTSTRICHLLIYESKGKDIAITAMKVQRKRTQGSTYRHYTPGRGRAASPTLGCLIPEESPGDVGKATEGLENVLWRRWSDGNVGEWAELIVIVIAELILQPFRHFTYVTTHSPTLPSLYLCHSSFSNPSFASSTLQALHLIHLASQQSSFFNVSFISPTSQLIPHPFCCFTYVTIHSPTLLSLLLRHKLFT